MEQSCVIVGRFQRHGGDPSRIWIESSRHQMPGSVRPAQPVGAGPSSASPRRCSSWSWCPCRRGWRWPRVLVLAGCAAGARPDDGRIRLALVAGVFDDKIAFIEADQRSAVAAGQLVSSEPKAGASCSFAGDAPTPEAVTSGRRRDVWEDDDGGGRSAFRQGGRGHCPPGRHAVRPPASSARSTGRVGGDTRCPVGWSLPRLLRHRRLPVGSPRHRRSAMSGRRCRRQGRSHRLPVRKL